MIAILTFMIAILAFMIGISGFMIGKWFSAKFSFKSNPKTDVFRIAKNIQSFKGAFASAKAFHFKVLPNAKKAPQPFGCGAFLFYSYV